MISQKRVCDFVVAHRGLIEELQPSFFEMNVALAFDEFARKKVDVAVIETGLGGRLDSTNVIVPELSLITNISFDHADLLGNTLELIATEKAGIIKAGIPVVISERQTESAAVFMQHAQKMQSALRFADDEVRWEGLHQRVMEAGTWLCGDAFLQETSIPIRSPLGAWYQKKNLSGVLVAVDELRKKGWKINDWAIITGIAEVVSITGLRGRWEKLNDSPRIYCDTGHNEAGIQEIIQQLAHIEFEQLHWVWGMVGDKEVTKILSLLPKNAKYYFCKAQLPRAMDAQQLQEKAQQFGLKGELYPSVKAALEAAKAAAQTNDLVLVGGSTFVVAEVI
jgi:dihydrofolate synthase/folylpolyglutamate synthase